MEKNLIDKSKSLLSECDSVLIGAGAGLTAAAGINYTDKDAFARYFPAWVKRGFSMQYQLMGYQNWTQEEQWGYYRVHLDYVYFQQQRNELYQSLRALIGDKDYFVMTSNVDELFHKNDFDRNKIYSPQGSYGRIQCTVPCSQKVWDMRPFFENMDAHFDPELQVLNDEAGVPKCPNCGEEMFINARMDHSFIEAPYQEEFKRISTWLSGQVDKKVLLLELGAGYNTPGVIRFPMENLKANFPNSSFIRINYDYAEIPQELSVNSVAVKGDIKEFISKMAA
ncbi:MAG: NAD-dependent protein deacetylase of SIR2 family [Bacteroidota bacterium]